MSTVTKPIILDETGQAIKGTLEEIRDAITDSGSTHYPVRIQVATPPEKIDYIVGETLDLTGIVVNAIYDNNVPYDVTSDCTFSPANGTTLDGTVQTITATWTWTLGQQTQTFTATRSINVSTVESISVTTPPTTTEYINGDTLDLTGMVVKATMSNDTQIDVTSQCTFSPADGATLTPSNTTVTATLSAGGQTYTATTPITVINPIYGVEWDGTSTTSWTRTDLSASFVDPVPYYAGMTDTPSSPFDDLLPWSGMVKEERTGGTMVKIPKFWYKITQNGSGMKIQISSVEQEGYSVSPAHMDRGDGEGERDYVYVGRYHCGSSNYKSVTGATPYNNQARSTMRSTLHNLGSNLWQIDFISRFTLWLLYIVEFAHWNSQDKIGYGCGNNSGVQNMGYTDSMPYHTGTTQSNRTTYGLGTQYRNIEGLWDNVFDWLDGCYHDSSGLNIILNPANFSDNSGGTLVGLPTSGQPSQFTVEDINGLPPIFIPTESNGSDTTYSCDYWEFRGSSPCLFAGGGYSQGLYLGLFYVNALSATSPGANRGCRLMELPTT